MSRLTFGQIITRAGIKAGDDTLTAEARFWLSEWLRKAYFSFPWPFLIQRANNIALAAGTQALNIGAGYGGIALEIIRVRDPIIIYTSDFRSRSEARVQSLTGNSASMDEAGRDPTTYVGLPTSFKLRPNGDLTSQFASQLSFTLIPQPFPDKAYLLAFDYFAMPSEFDTSDAGTTDADYPVYPNERTIIQALYAEMLKTKDGETNAYAAAHKLGASMLGQDQMRMGSMLGMNQSMDLDGSVFRDT